MGKTRTHTTIARLIFIGLTLITLILFMLDFSGNPYVKHWRATATDRAAPLLAALNKPTRFIGDTLQNFRGYQELLTENERLRQELRELGDWKNYSYRLDAENARLRALNKVSLPPRTSYITTEVIAETGGAFQESRLLNIGLDGGASDGAAVVNGAGLAGRIISIGRRASRMLLLTDVSSRVPVYIDPGGQRAILFGDGNARPILRFINPNNNLRIGAKVYTSGDGEVFPRGLNVGTVQEEEQSGFRVALETNYDDMQFVRILRYQVLNHDAENSALILPNMPNLSKRNSANNQQDNR